MAECGIGPTETYGKPLFELPPEEGEQIIQLLREHYPVRLSLLHDIKDILASKG